VKEVGEELEPAQPSDHRSDETSQLARHYHSTQYTVHSTGAHGQTTSRPVLRCACCTHWRCMARCAAQFRVPAQLSSTPAVQLSSSAPAMTKARRPPGRQAGNHRGALSGGGQGSSELPTGDGSA